MSVELADKKAAPVAASVAASAPVAEEVIVMERKSCWRQTKALTKKNMLLQYRNKAATGAQVCVGVAFILVLLLMDVAVTQNSRSNTWYIENLDPEAISAHEIARCAGEGCVSLVVYGKSAEEKDLGTRVANILKLKTNDWTFVNKSENTLKEWLFANENKTRVALEFKWPDYNTNYGNMPSEYIVHYNNTRNCDKTGIFFCEDPYAELLLPVMSAADSVLLRQHVTDKDALNSTAKDTARVKVSFKDFPHGDFQIVVDVMQRFGVGFIFMAVSFNFIVQLRNMVIEKQVKLRDAMRQIGLLDSAYWASWIVSSVVVNTCAVFALIAMGAIAQFPFFLLNEFGTYFTHLWISLWMFSCAAFLISSLTHNEQTASNIGLLFFLLFYLFGQIATFLFYGPFSAIGTNSYDFDMYRYLFMLVPGFAAPFGFYQGMNQMVLATSNGGGGLKMSEINLNIMPELTLSDGTVETTFWSLNLTWGLMFVNSFTCLALAVYFDNALPNSYGRKKGWFFCLNPKFWCPKERSAEAQRRGEDHTQKEDRSDLSRHIVPGMSSAVRAEAERIIKQDWLTEGKAPPVQVKGMDIFFPAYSLCERIQYMFSMCGCAKKPNAKNEVRAVQGITYGIDKDSLFVLLGHNGAGKTTTINALVGNVRTSGGTASVFGNDIGVDMGSINKIMGVCPQHDILWNQLTGVEHLELFSVLRGIPQEDVAGEVASRLGDVNLVKAGHTTSGAYSGGMKRRLSIALALLGSPKIVYLDEPTTGMDPVTRRSVWDMIMRAKRGRVIVLTTHSMEEADVLGDRVAIMSHGKIQALGTSLSLKKEYGGGYKMTLIAKSPDFYDGILAFMGEALEGCTLEANIDGAMFFRVPEVADDELVDFFLDVEECKDDIGISDLSIGLTTLEEVFLTLSKMDENEEFSYGATGKTQPAANPAKKRRPRFEFTLPDDAEPGEVVSVPHVQFPEDAAMNIDFKVPRRKKGGDVVRVKYTAHPELEFVVPADATEGTTLSLPHPQADEGADAIAYTVPNGVGPGDTIKIPYREVAGVKPVESETTSTSIEVSTTEGKNDGLAKKPALPTFLGYLSALTIKTIQFQKTRVAQTCCIVCMPVVLMLLLLLLGLLFDSVKLEIVCGEGVKKADCIEKGYNMTCVQNIFENSARPISPTIVVGEASWGSINPNCGTDKGEDDGERAFVCYDGLEKVKFNDVPFAATSSKSSGLGKISNKRDPLLIDWYQGFRYTLTSSRCQAKYDAKFEYENYCETDKTPKCQERLRNLIRTRTWKIKKDAEDAGDSAPNAGGFGLLDSCMPDSARRRERRLQSTWKPTTAQLDEYQSYVDTKIACDSAWLQTAADRLRASPLNDSNIGDMITTENEGLLGKFSSLDYTDEGMSSLQLSVLNSVWKNFSMDTDAQCLVSGSSEISLTELCNSTIAPTPNLQLFGRPSRPAQKTLAEIYFNSSCHECVGGIIGRLAQGLYPAGTGLGIPYREATLDATALLHISTLGFLGYEPSTFAFVNGRMPTGRNFDRWSTSWCRLLSIQDKFASGAMFANTFFWAKTDTTMDIYMPEDKKLWEAAWPPIYRAFMHGMDSTSTEKGRAAWDAFCTLDSNLDKVRGVTFIDEKTTDGVNTALIEDWYGDSVNTDYMKKTADRAKEGFRHHYYDVNMMAFDFKESDARTGAFDVIAYFNNSATEGGQRGVVDASKTHNGNWVSITNMIVEAIFGKLVGEGSRPDVKMQSFPNRFKCNRDEWLEGKAELDCPQLIPAQLQGSPLDSILDVFFPIILMLMIYPTVTSIVYEKQERLLIIMKMQGLPTPVYYIVTYVVHYVMYIAIVLLMWIVGTMAKVGIFTIHDQGVIWLLLILWGHLCIAFAFFLSTFFSSMRAAMAVTFLAILILWIVGGSVFGQFFDNYENTTETSYTIMGLLPPWLMARWAKWIINMAVQGTPITADNWTTLGNGVLPTTIWQMILEWFIFMGLYWYLENILSVGHGTAKGWCFCFDSCRNSGKTMTSEKTSDPDGIDDVPQSVHQLAKGGRWVRPHDVQAEHERTVDFSTKGGKDAPRVRICNIHKVYPATGGAPEKMAVKSVSFGVNEKECFGLLGHNGAGKTTLLNVLTGLFPATSGTAFVDEFRLDKDMSKIYAVMGVCPQHDILWGSLTGRQHVEFFGRLKGYSGDALAKMVNDVIKSVNLTYAEKRKCGGYSGGMKRRLSVANSIVGGPEIVYMDEPSTGLDPASKHQLWDVISASKAGKSMILTTHSMEEADVLCDRLAIMAGGELQCVGRSWQLKRRFGKGYTLGITTKDKSPEYALKIEKYVKGVFPSAGLIDDPIGGVSKFEIGREDVILSEVFTKLNSDMEQYGIVDWGLTETTLEEVFLKLAALAELFEDKKFRGGATSLSELDTDAQSGGESKSNDAKDEEEAEPKAE